MKKDWAWVMLLILVCVPASLPLLRGDFFHFSDENHIANLYQMVRSLQSGQLPPRWAPDFSYGYGYPFFNYFYPLPFYLGSGFFVVTGSLIWALKLVFLVTIPVSAVGMYLWLRQHAGRWASFVGGAIYVYTPYRAVDLYVRGAVGEIVAFALFPLIALFLYKVVARGEAKWIGMLGLAVAALMLSHNLAPLVFLPWFLIYGIILCWERWEWQRLAKVVAGVGLGVAGAAYFWFPAFWERNLLVSQTPFNWADHFPTIKQLTLPYWGYGGSNPGSGDEMSFQIGVVNLILVGLSGLAGVLAVVRRERRWLMWWFLVSVVGSVFLMNHRSSGLYMRFPLAAYVQFPWRFLILTTFVTSSLVIFLPHCRWGKVGLGLLLILSMGLTVGYFRPSEYFAAGDDYFLNRFFANRTVSGVRETVSKDYDLYSEDYLILPVWVAQRPIQLPPAKFMSEEVVVKEIVEETAVKWRVEVEGGQDGLVEMGTYYFPGWEVRVDEEVVRPLVLQPHGNMGVEVGEGNHELRVEWKETGLRKKADGVSVVAFVVMLGLVGFALRRQDETV